MCFFVHYTAVRSASFDIVCFISLVVVLFLIHSLALVTINVYSNNCNAAPNAPLTKLSTTKVSTKSYGPSFTPTLPTVTWYPSVSLLFVSVLFVHTPCRWWLFGRGAPPSRVH